MRYKFNYSSENYGLALIFSLLILNYGLIWTRGGYADDFAFLAYTEEKDLFSAISQWPFNSRLSQAILIPTLIKTLSGTLPGTFYWWVIHGISLCCLLLCVFLLNGILKKLDAPWIIRFSACLFFAIYPIKNTTVMWPATIIGYVIALTLFLLAVYIYFSRAKSNDETFVSLVSVWTLFLFSIFCIEQLLPLVALVIPLRLFLWRVKTSRAISHFSGGLSLLIAFAIFSFFGRTAGRILDHSLQDKSIFANALEVSIQSFVVFIEYPLRPLLDPYYRNGIFDAFGHKTFFISVLLLVVLSRLFVKLDRKDVIPSNKAILFLTGGLIIWFSALSPLMVIYYGVPDRVLFIPLIGISISVGAVTYLIDRYVNYFRYIVACFIIICGTAFSLVNIYSQNDFAKKWGNEQTLINSLKTLDNGFVESKTIDLFNFPSDYGPSPNLDDYFTLDGIVNWLYPGKNNQGDIQGNFSAIFQLPENASKFNYPETFFLPEQNHKVLLWVNNPNKIITIKELHLVSDTSTHQNQNDLGMVTGSIVKLDGSVKEKQYIIRTPYLIKLNSYNLGILRIELEYDQPITKHRLNIHIEYTNGHTLPYDKWVSHSTANTWSNSNSTLSTMLFISDLSTVKSITIFSDSDNKKKLKVSIL